VVLIPTTVLIPVVMSLCVIGAFAYRNAMFDGYLIVIFGILGYLMKRHDYPAIPLILGLILGPLAETNLYRSLQMSGGEISILFNRPIVVVLWAIIFLTVFGRPLYEKYRAKKSATVL
jgi:putative tricarboxylic transport membrane protein